jgi:hypothetical protein
MIYLFLLMAITFLVALLTLVSASTYKKEMDHILARLIHFTRTQDQMSEDLLRVKVLSESTFSHLSNATFPSKVTYIPATVNPKKKAPRKSVPKARKAASKARSR